MRKSMMLMAALLVTTLVFGQRHKNPGADAQARTEKMKTVLSLDEKQYAVVSRINEKYALQRSEIWKDTAGTRDEKRSSLRALHAAHEKEISAVLTPEQQAQWQAHKVEHAKKRKEHITQVRSNYHNRLRQTLSLTDEQSARMQEADRKFMEKLKSLRKGTDGTSKPDRATMRKLRTEHEAAVKSILTTEQFDKWILLREEMKNKRKQRRG